VSTPVWVELVCAHCAKTDIGRWSHNGQIPVRELKAEARKRGWLFKHNEVFCSDDCETHFEGVRQ
jgi:hypothetical protein